MLPPFADLLDIRADAESPGVLAMPYAAGVLGRPGFLHGGAISGLMEMAAIAELQAALREEARGDARIKPINVTVDFMRGGRDKLTRAAAIVTRLGTRVANVEAIAWQDEPTRPIAAARMNFLIVGLANSSA